MTSLSYVMLRNVTNNVGRKLNQPNKQTTHTLKNCASVRSWQAPLPTLDFLCPAL